MIPSSNLYLKSKVTPAHSRADVEEMLEKFGVKKFGWKRDEPTESYLMFQRNEDFTGKERPVTYKVTIPFIEKEVGKRYNKSIEHDEVRSYRILFHVLKALLLNTDVGMSFEQAFGNYIIIGQLPDGSPMSVGDNIAQSLVNDKIPKLTIQWVLEQKIHLIVHVMVFSSVDSILFLVYY